MPTNVVHNAADEADWEEAKRAATEKGKLSYALAMHIFQAKKKARTHTRASAKSANPITREDVSPADTARDQLDRGADVEKRVRPRFVMGAKPSPIGEPASPRQSQPETKGEPETETQKSDEHPDDRRERNARPHNRAARREYMKTPAGAAANRKAQENYRSSHPERVAAQHQARHAHGESGDAGHKCAVCGKPATHKHHNEGYGSGKGDRIRWLCHTHHVKAHHPKSNLGESKEKSMSNTPKVFEQIMKGAILESGNSAGTASATELRQRIAKAELKYAKATKKAVDAEARLTAMKSGQPMVDHPRPGASSSMGATTGGSSELTGGGEQHVPMVEHPRPGASAGGDTSKANPFASGKFKPFPKKGEKDDDKDDDGKGGNKDGKTAKPNPFAKRKEEASKAGKGFGGFGGKPPSPGEDDEHDEETKKSLESMTESELAAYRAAALAKAAGRASEIETLRKALSTIEHGEAGTGAGATTGATKTSAELGRGPGDEDASPFGTLGSMNGMPSVSPGQTVILSEDDDDVNAQLHGGEGALERTVPHGGASGLEASVHQVMGGDISAGSGSVSKSTGSLSLSGSGRLGAIGSDATYANEAARAAYVAQFQKGTGTPNFGVGLPPPPRDPTETPRAPQGREWTHGMVHYSTSEDARVAGLMEKSAYVSGASSDAYGGAVGEPTLNMQAPLLKSCVCSMCKSVVPAMFAKCPACGNDHGAGMYAGASTTLLSKSVQDSLRGPSAEGRVHPGGVLLIPSD